MANAPRLRACLLAALAATSGCGGETAVTPTAVPSASPSPDPDPVVGAAGDIACGSTSLGACRQMETSELLIAMRPSAVLALGDIQYEIGSHADFLTYYDRSWGRLKPITRPAPGNHEYLTRGASGYFDYFAGVGRSTSDVTGARGEGWYSFDVGTWHVISLNSNCSSIAGGCSASSPQLRWLRADLQSHAGASCTLAFWHHPRYSSGKSRDDRTYQPFWDALFEGNADVVLNGHDHGYERFAPQSPAGQLDASRGMRQFVVGTGGHSFQPFYATLPNSEVRNNDSFGVLEMRLRPGRYEWAFRPIPGASFTDGGSHTCH